MNQYFCPFRNERCIGECCKFFRRINHWDCLIIAGLNSIMDMHTTLENDICDQLSDIKDRLDR